MLWDSVLWSDETKLELLEILRENFMTFVWRLKLRYHRTFQQDNDPKYVLPLSQAPRNKLLEQVEHCNAAFIISEIKRELETSTLGCMGV